MRRVLVLSVVVLLGCPARVEPGVSVDSGSLVDAGLVVIDAGPPVPLTLEPTVIAGFGDGGTGVVTATAEIEAASSLTVSLPITLKDFRIRLMDHREQIVVSDDELLADGRTYVITLPEPLKTGRGYTLTLDAELGPVVTDLNGGTWNDWELAFRTAGEVQPEPSAAKRPTKKKRR